MDIQICLQMHHYVYVSFFQSNELNFCSRHQFLMTKRDRLGSEQVVLALRKALLEGFKVKWNLMIAIQ